MLTAAVRDLHAAHPAKFLTDVRTSCDALWENNPYITPLADDDREVELIDCEYPLIHKSNTHPVHFIHAFSENLEQQLGVQIKTGAFKGDIHIAAKEKSWISQVQEITREPLPFWIIVAGGKADFTIKWWDAQRWQKVVDHFRGRILFVQVGEEHHCHPQLEGVLDLRGKTNLRQLVRLVYHSQGVVCPVTLLMHLAAAVEMKCGFPKNRPCVVVAGGREPMQWEAYPHHQFIHTNGALKCCDQGGCWKSRTVPLGDADPKDESVCLDVVKVGAKGETLPVPLPRCMNMITSEEVVRRIQLYFDGGVAQFLTSKQAQLAEEAIARYTRLRRDERAGKERAKAGQGVLFVTLSDKDRFPGTVATINSALHFHRAGRVCVLNDRGAKKGLTALQRSFFFEHGVDVVEVESRRQSRESKVSRKGCGLANVRREEDVLVAIDSGFVLCSPIDDLIVQVRGGERATKRENNSRALASAALVKSGSGGRIHLLVCALNSKQAGAAPTLKTSTLFRLDGDQAVFNGIVPNTTGELRSLNGPLWGEPANSSQEPLRLKGRRLFNVSANAWQRALHCNGDHHFWSREHVQEAPSADSAALDDAWFLALLWFGRCRVTIEHFDSAYAHLPERLARHRHQLLEFALDIQGQLAAPGSGQIAAAKLG